MRPNTICGSFESGAPLATIEDMNRRMDAVSLKAAIGNVVDVHEHVVSEGLRGSDQDLLFEIVSSDFATKPVKTVVRISQGNTCLEPGSSITNSSDNVTRVVHNTEHSFMDGKVTTVSRVLVLGRVRLSWAFPSEFLVIATDTDTPAAASGNSASASVSGQPAVEVVPSVVRLVRPVPRHIVHQAIQRYPLG